MNRTSDSRSIPVWRCVNVACASQWATWEEGTTCPSCHLGLGEATGFTYGDLYDVAERFGFMGDLPVLISEPVPELVQLSEIPIGLWVGLPVFHPCGQEGTKANWLAYDVGVILEVNPDPNFAGELQCRFVTSMIGNCATLNYSPCNLWVPRALAERLQ